MIAATPDLALVILHRKRLPRRTWFTVRDPKGDFLVSRYVLVPERWVCERCNKRMACAHIDAVAARFGDGTIPDAPLLFPESIHT